MTAEIPTETTLEKRALLYIKQVNQELPQNEPANISTLAEESDWNGKYFSEAWPELKEKGLVTKKDDGVSTRLELTENGERYVELMLRMNEVLEK